MTSSARSISLGAVLEQRAAAGQRGVGDEDVDVARLVERAGRRAAAVGRGRRRGAAADLRGERLEHLGAPAGEDELSRRGREQRAGDGVADAAGGAGEQDAWAAEVHGAANYSRHG